MKSIFLILLIIYFSKNFGQSTPFVNQLLDSAKILFRSEKNLTQEALDNFDYSKIVSLLEKVIDLSPNNTEALYFLGYTYSRMNAKDGRGMIDLDLELMYKCSEQFEKVISITPKYTEEIIALDPYSKLSSEWGSMAMSYWHNLKSDSAKWAFSEGKKRGGYSKYILAHNRCILDACNKNSILISSGDNFSFPLWYLQIVENYRTDVAVVDISLLNTDWYPRFLANSNKVSFDLPNEQLDTIEYSIWKDSLITINHFSWIVAPSFYNHYILRGDRVLLSLLKANKFQRDVFFTTGFMEDYRLSLKNYIEPNVFIEKLNTIDKNIIAYEIYKKNITKALKLSQFLNINSPDECRMFDNFRYEVLSKIKFNLDNGDKQKAKELFKLLDQYANENTYPYQDIQGKNYADFIRKQF